MWNAFQNFLFMRSQRARKISQKWVATMQSEGCEEFLHLLLHLMRLVFLIDSDFRRNMENFSGRYLFCSRDRQITVAAVFANSRLQIKKEEIPDTDVTVIFRNARALMGFLLSPKPDILGAVLRQDVTVEGNLNYLYKFAFMAKRLQLQAAGGL